MTLTQHLRSWILPGVRETLAALRDVGLQLAVVSNSDGTIESGLANQGLRHYFDAVVDSHVVGYEKPDPRIFQSGTRTLWCCSQAHPTRR